MGSAASKKVAPQHDLDPIQGPKTKVRAAVAETQATAKAQAAARAELRRTPRVEMPVASEYKQLLAVSGSPQITPVLLLILWACC